MSSFVDPRSISSHIPATQEELPDSEILQYTPLFIPQRDHGTVNIPVENPLQTFQAFFSQDIVDIIVKNSNKYLEKESFFSVKKPLSSDEYWRYLGIRIQTSLTKLHELRKYWSSSDKQPVFTQISRALSKNRFFAIESIHHWSDPDEDEKKRVFYQEKTQNPQVIPPPWEKTEQIADILRQKCVKNYSPSSSLTVDEAMIAFDGRDRNIVHLRGKPIPIGFKTWCLADHGYLIDWLWHSGAEKASDIGQKPGPIGLNPSVSQGLSATESVVATLATRFQSDGNFDYAIYVDNLFSSNKLATRLLQFGYGIAGTARRNLSATDFHPDLAAIRRIKNMKKPWGWQKSRISGQVLNTVWQDSVIVGFLSTIHLPETVISRKRRKPRSTATNGGPARVNFLPNEHEKNINIPVFIDDYNHHMGGVDIADQSRAYIPIGRRHMKNWKAIASFLIEISVCNAFFISRIANQQKISHLEWLETLAYCLMQQGLAPNILLVPQEITCNFGKFSTKKTCAECQIRGIKRQRRIALGEVTGNVARQRSPTSYSGCLSHQVWLCNQDSCRGDHLARVRVGFGRVS